MRHRFEARKLDSSDSGYYVSNNSYDGHRSDDTNNNPLYEEICGVKRSSHFEYDLGES
jgi:hypothetical protein